MTKKSTFANEGIKTRGILEGHEDTKPKGRKPKGEKMGKNPLRTYLTDAELERVRKKAGDVPIATYLRNFLREKGFFD
jgi:hypothetical protein